MGWNDNPLLYEKNEAATLLVVVRCFGKIMRKQVLFLLIVCFPLGVLGVDKREQARAILDRNQVLTELRAPGSPSFRLAATFAYQVTAQKSAPVHGTYELLWSSPGEWKEDFQSGTAHVIRVFANGKLSRSAEGIFPAPDSDISSVFAPPPQPEGLVPRGVQKSSSAGKSISCVEMRFELPAGVAGFSNVERTECFDDASGLLSQVQMQASGKPNLWDFSDYEPWGNGKFVPTTLKYQASSGEYFEVHVSKIALESFDTSQFSVTEEAPPPPANCKMQPPRALQDPEPNHSNQALQRRRNIRAVYKVRLGSDGVPIEVAPQISGGDLFDQESIWALMRWRFAPAKCAGKPSPVTIAVELSYSAQD
jgi:hypothetical protein